MTTTPAERIGGWLLGPLAWLLLTLLSTSLALMLYATALLTPQTVAALGAQTLKEKRFVVRFVRLCYRHLVLHVLAGDRLF